LYKYLELSEFSSNTQSSHNLDSIQSFIPFLLASQLHNSISSFSSTVNKLGQQTQSDKEIEGGNISPIQHITAGIHSHIGTQSGGAHLNKASSSSTHAQIFEANKEDDIFILSLITSAYGLSAFHSGSIFIYMFCAFHGAHK
jgi:hypothetical protein